MRVLPLLVACALLGVVAPVHAADHNGVYAGLSIGQVKSDVPRDIDDLFDDTDTGFKLFLGLRPIDWLGVEVSYINFGEVRQTQGIGGFSGFKVEQTGFSAFGMAFLDVEPFDLFAKAGLIQWDSRLSRNSFFGNFGGNESGTALAFGAGAQVHFGNLAARVEYERYDIDEDDGLVGKPQLLSIGVSWTFF